MIKKFFIPMLYLLLLSSCAESLALLGPATTTGAGGNYARGAFTSSVSLGIKKQTGKTPMEHALSYANKHNPENKKSKCVSFLEATNSEICEAVKKNIIKTKNKLAEKSKIKNLSNN